MNATAIVPVKRFGAAKQRLLDRLDRAARGRLVAAMLTDVLDALARCEAVERVIVVTGERRAERIALQAARRVATPLEVIRDPDDAGHSEAATIGIVRARYLGAECAALLPGDCPLLDPAELGAALGRMRPGRVGVVPDRHGTGTNALLLSPVDAISPGFGPDSHSRHLQRARSRGLEAATEELASLSLDLDTPDDLDELQGRLGGEPELAPRTAEALEAEPQRRPARRGRRGKR